MTSSKPTSKGGIRNIPAPQGNKAPSVYSRFIPREELADFAAWTPGMLDGPSTSATPALGVQRPAPPAPPAPSPEDELKALLNANRQQAYQDGYRDGLAALEGFKQTHARQMSNQIGALVQSIGNQLDELQQDMARAIAVSATHLARQIVRTELQARPELVAMVAGEALDTLLLSARHITLRVHPDDQVLVTQGAADVLAARGARVIADTTVARGGCLVDSDIGSIDATMETRWRRAAAALGCDEAWAADETADAPTAVREERRA
ncbi:MAG: flagellar biosynthesis protein [Ideonella sp.]|nr:flagellar biosynthesis protein [Ideonella sp.]